MCALIYSRVDRCITTKRILVKRSRRPSKSEVRSYINRFIFLWLMIAAEIWDPLGPFIPRCLSSAREIYASHESWTTLLHLPLKRKLFFRAQSATFDPCLIDEVIETRLRNWVPFFPSWPNFLVSAWENDSISLRNAIDRYFMYKTFQSEHTTKKYV